MGRGSLPLYGPILGPFIAVLQLIRLKLASDIDCFGWYLPYPLSNVNLFHRLQGLRAARCICTEDAEELHPWLLLW